MKVIAFNGSPRKKGWNTVTLLENALKGAASEGAQTELINLYDLKYSGCISCFACKKINRKNDGVCAVKDDLTSVLDRVRNVDALIIGTPVYFSDETAATRALLERLMFPYYNYSKDEKSLFPKKIRTGLIYTMNAWRDILEQFSYDKIFGRTKTSLERIFGECEMLLSTNTLQYNNYDKYDHEIFNKEEKIKRHTEVFPLDCDKAFKLGKNLLKK
mgnify:CR=1 FL=1